MTRCLYMHGVNTQAPKWKTVPEYKTLSHFSKVLYTCFPSCVQTKPQTNTLVYTNEVCLNKTTIPLYLCKHKSKMLRWALQCTVSLNPASKCGCALDLRLYSHQTFSLSTPLIPLGMHYLSVSTPRPSLALAGPLAMLGFLSFFNLGDQNPVKLLRVTCRSGCLHSNDENVPFRKGGGVCKRSYLGGGVSGQAALEILVVRGCLGAGAKGIRRGGGAQGR